MTTSQARPIGCAPRSRPSGFGTTEAASIQGRQVVLLTMTGARTGATRKVPLMRVEHDGVYAAVGSRGGTHRPAWVRNLDAEPTSPSSTAP